jgi:SCY1-like protein 1
MVREQANKTLDLYLLRVRRHAATMADTSLPATDGVGTANSTSTRMGNSGDTSWAGWAISSFTNKTTTAKGEMKPTVNGSTSVIQIDSRSTSLPASGRTTPAMLLSSDKSSFGQTGQERISVKPLAMSDQEPDDAFEAWGTMDDEDDSFFDAPSSRKQSPGPRPATSYNDGGEPDFAGWLAAQSQAKSKKPLPKGLTNTSNIRPHVADQTKSTGTMGSGSGAQKLLNTTSKPKVTVPVRKVDTKPKETESTEEGWGDDWD